ncbi:unnamed protein product [Candidula unifasciata]|uniref:2-aminoethanethiol dioxygenase n=1 Tax=Candidula unifasciata TaxID=100452 RepID=A0A8S3ZU31_9EUPU|nr:unnamed protein product [Candidula unifasciata]
MAAPILKLAQLSTKIFGVLSPEKITKDHLSPLIRAMNNISSEDVYFDPKEIEERDAELQKLGEVAPVTYMHIHQDHNFTMAVFVVKAGSVLPLHDHPKMHGLLKVLYGKVRISSYTEVDQKPLPENIARLQVSQSQKRSNSCIIKTVYRHNDIVLSETDECCVLSPSVGNFHEIQPETKFAAFLDVLAPPYEGDCDSGCHYYKDLNPGKTSIGGTTWLKEIPQPSFYWCDTIKYKGPLLTCL